jgi:hypothetical protein
MTALKDCVFAGVASAQRLFLNNLDIEYSLSVAPMKVSALQHRMVSVELLKKMDLKNGFYGAISRQDTYRHFRCQVIKESRFR